jgi:hypothetical protein
MLARSIYIAIFVGTISTIFQGCAAYTVVSIGSYAATGKSLGDHAGSKITGGDCNLIKHTVNGEYVCEMPVVYNRSPF